MFKKLAMSLVLFISGLTQAAIFPTHLQSQINEFSYPYQSVSDFTAYMKWDHAPNQNFGQYNMFWMYWESGSGGYTGLQADSQGKRLIFSMWDSEPQSTQAAHSNCNRYGHEGTGTQCFLSFDWQPQWEYKFTVRTVNNPADTTGVTWEGVAFDPIWGKEYVIGRIRTTNSRNGNGHGLIVTSGSQFVHEYYSGPAGSTCASLPVSTVTYRGPFGNNGRVRPIAARVNETAGTTVNTERCMNGTMDTRTPYGTTFTSGGNTVKMVAPTTNLYERWDMTTVRRVDCVMDWAENNYRDILPVGGISKYEQPLYFRMYGTPEQHNQYAILVNLTNGFTQIANPNGTVTPLGAVSQFFATGNCANVR